MQAAVVETRDTDADWRALGASEPFWGVLSQPQFRRDSLNDETLAAFYESGRQDIAHFMDVLERHTGARPAGRALDFGCGVGRLAEAMAEQVAEVVGYDISPGMLQEARARDGRATYVSALPDGPFDWLNSYIVFQHIPPERGLAILDDLLGRLAPTAFLSLHVTIGREAALAARGGWRDTLAGLRRRSPQAGVITMYDYDLSEVVGRLNRAGFRDLRLLSTDHGGHHGVIVLGRRSAA